MYVGIGVAPFPNVYEYLSISSPEVRDLIKIHHVTTLRFALLLLPFKKSHQITINKSHN